MTSPRYPSLSHVIPLGFGERFSAPPWQRLLVEQRARTGSAALISARLRNTPVLSRKRCLFSCIFGGWHSLCKEPRARQNGGRLALLV